MSTPLDPEDHIFFYGEEIDEVLRHDDPFELVAQLEELLGLPIVFTNEEIPM